ncbi:predicted protein [Streptomyces iranensis]|uniref:Uncharacterized protein n=1 Tax=Streptomyces iranensis TaxID=576784 RepID=A0A060ZIB5_9ACTN|nr:predicted protein [Streptomyces iranensis]
MLIIDFLSDLVGTRQAILRRSILPLPLIRNSEINERVRLSRPITYGLVVLQGHSEVTQSLRHIISISTHIAKIIVEDCKFLSAA